MKIFYSFITTSLFTLLITTSTYCQGILWATQVLEYSSEIEENNYSHLKVLGEPDAMPNKGHNINAWEPKTDDRKEFIKVGFSKPIKAKYVYVAESYHPGALCRIVAFHKDNIQNVELYKVTAASLEDKSRLFKLKIENPVNFEIASIKIYIDCRLVPGENQIDAIGISEEDVDVTFKKDKIADVKFYSQLEKLNSNVNSNYTEVLPCVSPDGLSLFFARKDFPPHTTLDKIWVSEKKDEDWGKADMLRAPLNNLNNNWVNSITPDNNQMLLGNEYYPDGSTGSGASFTYRTATGWSFPFNLKIKNFVNTHRYVNYCLSNDTKTIIMSVARSGTKGESDFYASFRQKDDTWSEPMRMGDSINTNGGETTPFLASDGKTLYFSTNGLNGYGSNDIYMSRRKDDTWKNWTTPLNLGPSINSDDWDAYFTIPASGDYAYLVRGSDIFRIKLNEEVKPFPVILVSGKVLDKKTNLPLAASISYEDLATGKEAGLARSNPSTGEYKIVLPYGAKYGFSAKSKGYISISDNLDATQLKEYEEVTRDLYMVPIEVGQTIRINNIFFDFNQAILKPESKAELERLASLLTENSSMKIEIHGHTDHIGSDAENQKLSENRAKSVGDWLSSKGLGSRVVKTTGFGESKPLVSNETEEGRKINRRVEFVILSK